MVSNSIRFIFEDKIKEIENPDPNETILNLIRLRLKKTGTKEGCAEGGCGACTVVLGELKKDKIIYKAINACIAFTTSLEGKHLLIVEDLIQKNGSLHPVQRHKFPEIDSSIVFLSYEVLFLYIENKDIMKPGVQNPHWEPWKLIIALCTGCKEPSFSIKSSTISNCLPSRLVVNAIHELIAL